MIANYLDTLIVATSAIAHFVAALLALVRPAYRRGFARLLVGYLTAVGIWELGLLLPAGAMQERLVAYGFLLLAFYFLYLTQGFLRVDDSLERPWLIGGAVTLLVLIILDVLAASLTWQVLRSVWLIALLLVWGGLWGRTAVFTIRAYRDTERRPLHRNRISYWLLVILLIIVADLAALTGSLTLATILRLLATILAAYASLTYRLIDLGLVLDRILSHLLAVIVIGLLYEGGYIYLSEFAPAGVSPTLSGAGLVMLLVLLFQPIQHGIQSLVARLMAENKYDTNRTLREYSQTISNIVDLTELEGTAVRLISEAMEISYGTLYLIDTGEDLVGRSVYQLISVHGFGADKLVLGSFTANSPVADYLAKERRPLMQFDIDLQPRFQEVEQLEREWLADLGVEIFVPICVQDRWIGLLGLGPKVAGTRYYDHDLLLLSTLADQTAVALENARLVADLVRLNRDLQNAYASLEQANQQLQERDQLKSDFIGVISHELRTPFAHIGFALQLIEQHGLDSLSTAQREEFNNLQQGVKSAHDMVENLVKFASFVKKQGALRCSEFDFAELVVEVVRPLQPLAANKNIQLHLDENGASLSVSADRDRLTDAIHHLVHNAIKFTPEGGQIHVRMWQKNAHTSFEVQDTGCGIPDGKLAELWDGFAQIADPLKRGTEGIGLGLTLVKYTALAHNGDVFAHSAKSIGSLFGFTFPSEQE
ncbi:MAG: GAF domain-containing protein [Ardenticatenaceae bacterium]|nr:GAF domain-containing protein [Anaerolineales bacterium]MCB8921967.1 GAF domain-containing protein [Ardenticatenaceae bacterium]MCB8989543.1 GAF domain-containing protein [Ardenticatenaceae bacterium]MCB9003086.1 GAF domain-containing protein [Ardenticatenaceae bacterium]